MPKLRNIFPLTAAQLDQYSRQSKQWRTQESELDYRQGEEIFLLF